MVQRGMCYWRDLQWPAPSAGSGKTLLEGYRWGEHSERQAQSRPEARERCTGGGVQWKQMEYSNGKNKWRLGDSNAQDKAITLDFVILAWPLESQDLEKFQKTEIIYHMINTDPR